MYAFPPATVIAEWIETRGVTLRRLDPTESTWIMLCCREVRGTWLQVHPFVVFNGQEPDSGSGRLDPTRDTAGYQMHQMHHGLRIFKNESPLCRHCIDKRNQIPQDVRTIDGIPCIRSHSLHLPGKRRDQNRSFIPKEANWFECGRRRL